MQAAGAKLCSPWPAQPVPRARCACTLLASAPRRSSVVFGKGLRNAQRVFETRQTVFVGNNVDWGPRQRTPSEFRGRTERGESGRVATYSSLGLPLELSLRLCVPASPRALCALTSPGVNILASGMLFSGQRVSELRCERQVAYVLRRLGGSERSTELARSTPTAVSLTTHPPRPGRMV